MLIRHRLEDLAGAGQPLHLAFGMFDGLHAGHQEVIRRATDAAKKRGGLAGLVTFDPHPIRVIAPDKAPAALLTPLDHKARLAAELGLDWFVPLHFDSALAAMPAGEFVERLTRAPVRTIAVGEDWRFGHHRTGDVAMLAAEAETRGFTLEAVPPVMFEGDRISSTRIRQAVRDGNLWAATQMLGRPFSVFGNVVPGRQLGRDLGFPTANLATEGIQLPPDGVWAVHVDDGSGTLYKGVANLGRRPTLGGGNRLLEVHLLDFSGDLYGKVLDVRFIRHVRPEMKFDSLEALRERIALDVAAARALPDDEPPQAAG